MWKSRRFGSCLFLAVLTSSTFGFSTRTSLIQQRPFTSRSDGLAIQRVRPQSSTKLEGVVVPEIWTSLIPTSLGYINNEYGFSYAYGFGTALSAISIMRRFPNSILPLHAMAIVFYGLRLNTFLFLRTLVSTRQKEMIKRIEERAVKRGNRFTTRTPVLLSLGLFYYALVAPAVLTSKLSMDMVPTWGMQLLKTLVGVTWFGFGIAAIGDLTKTYVKQSQKDEYYLVTSGIFSVLRHPNYTGEIIGWTSSSLCGILAGTFLLQQGVTASIVANLLGQALGWVGIVMVLLRASTNLERRHKETYGNDEKYQKWIESSWEGWTLPEKAEPHEEPHLEFHDVDEDSGSGI